LQRKTEWLRSAKPAGGLSGALASNRLDSIFDMCIHMVALQQNHASVQIPRPVPSPLTT